MSNQHVKNKTQTRWLVALIVILVAAAGIIIYLNRARAEYVKGMAAYEAFDYSLAKMHFQQVTGFYRLASSSNVSQAQQLLNTEIQPMLDADDKRRHGDYASAIEIYETFVSLNPKSAHKEFVNAYIPVTYLEWGDALIKAEDYEAGIEKNRVIV